MKIPEKQLEKQLAKLPAAPGVYLMKDSLGEIIYIGKSRNLRARVRSYFRSPETQSLKTKAMVMHITDFDYIITDSETEALILEANLIKKNMPRFNILLKDDKMYPYIALTTDDFPRVFATRSPEKFPSAKIYGPFVSADSVHKSIEVIHQNYRLRQSSHKITGDSARPCLNYHMDRCTAPCCGFITREDYAENVRLAAKILTGDKAEITASLKSKMAAAAESLNFERAAVYRDQINALENLSVKQKMIQQTAGNQDYISGFIHKDKACAMLFKVRNGKMEEREIFTMRNAASSTEKELLEAFLTQYYSGPANIPREIYISENLSSNESYQEWLSQLLGKKVKISVPLKGKKLKTIQLVYKNAKEYLLKFENRIEREFETQKIVESQLRQLLKIDDNTSIDRIECYDISNILGMYNVGAMVAYESGKKKRSDYRRYRIKSVEGPDDYASMAEVVERRIRRGKNSGLPDPDLILIDGGLGHVNAVNKRLKELSAQGYSVSNILVAGMVKDDFHKTEDLIFNGIRVGLANCPQAFKAVYAMQEEVHRFAVDYHRNIRSKEMISSELEDIKGVGEKLRIALLKKFGSVDNIKKASIEQLTEIPRLSKTVAQNIIDYFRR